MRQEFEMSETDLAELLEACRPVPMIMLQCGEPPSAQENANRAWQKLANKLGFVWDSVEPSSKGQRYFTAQPNQQPRKDSGD